MKHLRYYLSLNQSIQAMVQAYLLIKSRRLLLSLDNLLIPIIYLLKVAAKVSNFGGNLMD